MEKKKNENYGGNWLKRATTWERVEAEKNGRKIDRQKTLRKIEWGKVFEEGFGETGKKEKRDL